MAPNARLEELKRKFDETPRRYFAPLANEYRKQGDLTQAITLCRAHLPNQPGHVSGHIVLAQALFEARELPEARHIFEQALELDPENLIALRILGDIAYSQGDMPGARSWYERVLEADPRNDEIAQLVREMAVEAESALHSPQSDRISEVPHNDSWLASHTESAGAPPPLEPQIPQHTWDPDRTPVANVAVAGPMMESQFLASPTLPPTIAPSADNDAVDRGPDLVEPPEPIGADAFRIDGGFSLPVVEQVAESVEASAALPNVESVTTESHAKGAEPETIEAFDVELPDEIGADTIETDLAQDSFAGAALDVSGSLAWIAEAEKSSAGSAQDRFEEDCDAFAAAEHLSDPEAHPVPAAPDWYSVAVSTPDDVDFAEAESHEPAIDKAETLVIQTAAAGRSSQDTTVDLGAFDLIESRRDEQESGTLPPTGDRVRHAEMESDFEAAAVDIPADWFGEVPVEPEPETASRGEDLVISGVFQEEWDVESVMQGEAPSSAQPAPQEVEKGADSAPLAIDDTALVADVAQDGPAPVHAAASADPVGGHTMSESVDAVPTPAMFVTGTMAELYVQQGFTDEALEVYRRLLEQNPGDAAIRGRIAALEGGELSSLGEPPAPPPDLDRAGQSVGNFFGRIARRQPHRPHKQSALDVTALGAQVADRFASDVGVGERESSPTLSQLFAGAPTGEDDTAAGAHLASAFAPPEASGRPTRAADSELSLDHLFRDVSQEASGAVTLDAFFAAAGGDTTAAAGSAGSAADQAERMGDIEQFTAWLEGLKKK